MGRSFSAAFDDDEIIHEHVDAKSPIDRYPTINHGQSDLSCDK